MITMTTSSRGINIPLRRALLLACTALAALHAPCCNAFSSCPPLARPWDGVRISSQQKHVPSRARYTSQECLYAKATNGEDRSHPKIVVIKTHEDYVKFLEEDDRLCVIKYYANWCKSCQKFGQKFRHLAFDEGDRVDIEGSIVRSGNVRFAEVEYAASPKLCKLLKVKKLPTVHMHKRGMGKIVDMTCKPSLFHLVIDEMRRAMDDSLVVAESSADMELEMEKEEPIGNAVNVTGSSSFDRAMTAGAHLADEIMSSLGKKKEEKEGAPKKEKSPWFVL